LQFLIFNLNPVVSIQNISKIYSSRGADDVVALQDVSMDIHKGDFISLIGPSGCGKSTLLRLIADLITPTQGNIIINGKPAHQARLDRDYGMVFQSATLFEWRSVTDNVELPLELMGYSKAERQERAQAMLELVELGRFGNHYPWQLSGGMQQRVSIARALAFEPPLLLMDEPFGALDEMTRERMNMEILKLQAQMGITVVFVTHSINEAVFLSTKVVVLSARPGCIAEIIDVDLPYPRNTETREHPRYFQLAVDVRESLREHEGGGE